MIEIISQYDQCPLSFVNTILPHRGPYFCPCIMYICRGYERSYVFPGGHNVWSYYYLGLIAAKGLSQVLDSGGIHFTSCALLAIRIPFTTFSILLLGLIYKIRMFVLLYPNNSVKYSGRIANPVSSSEIHKEKFFHDDLTLTKSTEKYWIKWDLTHTFWILIRRSTRSAIDSIGNGGEFFFFIYLKCTSVSCDNLMLIHERMCCVSNLFQNPCDSIAQQVEGEPVSRRCEFKYHSSQQFSVDFGSIRLIWKNFSSYC